MAIAEHHDQQRQDHLRDTRFEYNRQHANHCRDHPHHGEVVVAFLAQTRVLWRARVLSVMSELS